MQRTSASAAGPPGLVSAKGARAFLLLLLLSSSALPALAQSAKLADDPPPPYGAAELARAAKTAPVPSAPDSAAAAAPAGPVNTSSAPAPPAPPAEAAAPVFDPLHANRSLEVGIFYMKKGEYEAAIDRYEEAARFNSKLARPYALLAEVYEKTNDPAKAVAAYRKYLQLFPAAPDHEKIARRIEKLTGKSETAR